MECKVCGVFMPNEAKAQLHLQSSRHLTNVRRKRQGPVATGGEGSRGDLPSPQGPVATGTGKKKRKRRKKTQHAPEPPRRTEEEFEREVDEKLHQSSILAAMLEKGTPRKVQPDKKRGNRRPNRQRGPKKGNDELRPMVQPLKPKVVEPSYPPPPGDYKNFHPAVGDHPVEVLVHWSTLWMEDLAKETQKSLRMAVEGMEIDWEPINGLRAAGRRSLAAALYQDIQEAVDRQVIHLLWMLHYREISPLLALARAARDKGQQLPGSSPVMQRLKMLLEGVTCFMNDLCTDIGTVHAVPASVIEFAQHNRDVEDSLTALVRPDPKPAVVEEKVEEKEVPCAVVAPDKSKPASLVKEGERLSGVANASVCTNPADHLELEENVPVETPPPQAGLSVPTKDAEQEREMEAMAEQTAMLVLDDERVLEPEKPVPFTGSIMEKLLALDDEEKARGSSSRKTKDVFSRPSGVTVLDTCEGVLSTTAFHVMHRLLIILGDVVRYWVSLIDLSADTASVYYEKALCFEPSGRAFNQIGLTASLMQNPALAAYCYNRALFASSSFPSRGNLEVLYDVARQEASSMTRTGSFSSMQRPQDQVPPPPPVESPLVYLNTRVTQLRKDLSSTQSQPHYPLERFDSGTSEDTAKGMVRMLFSSRQVLLTWFLRCLGILCSQTDLDTFPFVFRMFRQQLLLYLSSISPYALYGELSETVDGPSSSRSRPGASQSSSRGAGRLFDHKSNRYNEEKLSGTASGPKMAGGGGGRASADILAALKAQLSVLHPGTMVTVPILHYIQRCVAFQTFLADSESLMFYMTTMAITVANQHHDHSVSPPGDQDGYDPLPKELRSTPYSVHSARQLTLFSQQLLMGLSGMIMKASLPLSSQSPLRFQSSIHCTNAFLMQHWRCIVDPPPRNQPQSHTTALSQSIASYLVQYCFSINSILAMVPHLSCGHFQYYQYCVAAGLGQAQELERSQSEATNALNRALKGCDRLPWQWRSMIFCPDATRAAYHCSIVSDCMKTWRVPTDESDSPKRALWRSGGENRAAREAREVSERRVPEPASQIWKEMLGCAQCLPEIVETREFVPMSGCAWMGFENRLWLRLLSRGSSECAQFQRVMETAFPEWPDLFDILKASSSHPGILPDLQILQTLFRLLSQIAFARKACRDRLLFSHPSVEFYSVSPMPLDSAVPNYPAPPYIPMSVPMVPTPLVPLDGRRSKPQKPRKKADSGRKPLQQLVSPMRPTEKRKAKKPDAVAMMALSTVKEVLSASPPPPKISAAPPPNPVTAGAPETSRGLLVGVSVPVQAPARRTAGRRVREPDTSRSFPLYLNEVPMTGKMEGVGVTRLVVLDAPNIAMRHGINKRFSCHGLELATEFFVSKGYKVVSFLPDYELDYERVAGRRRAAQLGMGDVRPQQVPDNVSLLLQLQEKSLLVSTPAQDYDDSYCLRYAMSHNGVVVSNDMYRDYMLKLTSQRQRKNAKKWFRSHVCSFTFVGDEFMPNPDFSWDSSGGGAVGKPPHAADDD